ncbi:MAG: hypothetical protein ABIE25_07295 [Thermoplasmatota archaeon]|nr:hypothetical protein [Candidatus Thermoplasmatota archaeon]MBU1915031.1 hypothetical protein [Candidatus Thermoplasmatota archaeon]
MSVIQLKVNVLCVLGTALGFASLFFPWIIGGDLPDHVHYRDLLVNDILLGPPGFTTVFILACSMFVVGSGLAFVTPTGGFAQLGGMLGFLYAYPAAYRDMQGTQELSLGAYLGILSVAVVLVGLCLPIGPGHRSNTSVLRRMVSTANRFLTFSPYDSSAKLRINLLCVIGAFIAFVAIALPWLTMNISTSSIQISPLESNLYQFMKGSSAWKVGAWIFILSSAAAFVTPLAGLTQLMGLLWWWGSARNSLGTSVVGDLTWTSGLGNGIWLGAFAVAVVLVSFIFPIGFGYLGRRGSIKARLFAWGKPAASRIP